MGLRIREAIVEAMLLLYNRGLINLHGGNASALLVLPDGTRLVYITPRGLEKNKLSSTTIAVMDVKGHVYWGEPSSEHPLHLEVYRRMSNVRAIVHSHNPLSVAVVESGGTLNLRLLGVEAEYYMGHCVSMVPPIKPGTVELARRVASALEECPLVVLRGHGAVAVGFSSDPVKALFEAVDRLEVLEDIARSSLLAR